MYSIDAHAHFNYTPGFFGNYGYGAKGSVHQQSLENRPAVFSTREGKAPDDDSYIGYSTVVGHFKKGEQYEGIAVGMPRGNKLKGKVLLFTWNLINYKNITISQQIGSYFGYSIAAADVDGDNKLDLIVGAPMHTEANTEDKYDVGRVYVFYQTDNFTESFNTSHFIDGINSRGRFGHALSSLGDVNQDGYDDFAVGAPYDGPHGRGAVYIFYGSAAGIRQKYGQVIYAEDITGVRQYLTTFGFSLAGGLDLDNNEYPDMAVGAYLSDSAFFFRARPVVFIDSYVEFKTQNKKIDIKQKNCLLPNGEDGTCTSIAFCIKYRGKGIPDQLSLNVEYILDTMAKVHRMGFKSHGSHTFNRTIILRKDGAESCKTEEIYMRNEIKDKLTPLEAEVKFYMIEDNSYEQLRNPLSQLKPVLDLNNPPSRTDAIMIQNNCGDDNICIPNLHVNVTSNVKEYLLNSNTTLEFDVIVSNFGEDSFETTFVMTYPTNGIFYKRSEIKIPGLICTESTNKTVVCDIGNPLPSGKIASFKVFFQPYHKGGSPNHSYHFDILVNSSNPEPLSTFEDNKKHIEIEIWIDATIDIKGQTYSSLQPLSHYNNTIFKGSIKDVRKETEIGPQVTHVYFLTNQGPSQIQRAEVFLLWPLTTLGDEDLLYLLEQPITKGNVKCDWSPLVNYRKLELESYNNTIWERLKIDVSAFNGGTASAHKKDKNEGVIETDHEFNSGGTSGEAIETNSGIDSGIGVVNKNQDKLDKEIKQSGGDSSSVIQDRHNETSEHMRSWGTLNPHGEYEYTVSKYFITYENGEPVTKWENTTTIRDAQGNILRTLYYNDNTGSHSGSQLDSLNYKIGLKQGEYEHKTAKWFTTYVNGEAITRWENKTVVTDLNGNVLRSYVWDDYTGEYRLETGTSGSNINAIQEELRRKQQQERIEEERRQELFRQERIRQAEEAKRLEERKKIEEQNRRTLEERRQEEVRRRQEAIRKEEEKKREEERIRLEERKRAEERRIEEEERRRTEEWRREEERRRLEESSRPAGSRYPDNRYDEERRREEERRRQDEIRREQIRLTEERRRQEQWRKQQEEQRRIEEERIRVEEEKRRIEEERRRQQVGGESNNNWSEERRYYEEKRRLAGQGGSIDNKRVVTGYFDENGIFHGNPNEFVFNKTVVVESSTSFPIDISGGETHTFGGREGNLNDLGTGFTIQTLDLGGGRGSSYNRGSSRSGASGSGSRQDGQGSGSGQGGYTRDWHTEGGYSTSGQIPPTFIHNSIDRDNVPTDNQFRSTRSKRQITNNPYEDIQALVKCNATKCIYIRCVVGALGRDDDVLIALRSRLNVRGLKDLADSNQAITLSSKMVAAISELPYVDPIKKEKQVWKQRELFTEVPAKEAELVPEVAPLWLYIVSAVAGIVMLLLLIWLLSKCGFFKRNRPSSGPERQPLNRNGYHSGDEAL
ncbi:unnamed protein product [Psylliodes chrysocephalus]|uniref:Integrin alpha-2 domain-containing protein n=2 Tax=Psylliodes chrysocephalus TaxID=3402493 RepID=A0A9P0CIW9_9CUCU|nr:unnamed protein product [Psylliodes chrysocephala]